jgi:hypothetical protein
MVALGVGFAAGSLPGAISAERPAASVVEAAPAPSPTVIRLGGVAVRSELPAEVASQMDSVVKVKVHDLKKMSVLSGVLIRDAVLTSAHGFREEDGSDSYTQCTRGFVETSFDTAAPNPNMSAASITKVNPNSSSPTWSDLAVMKGYGPTVPHRARVTPGPEDRPVGEEVVFVNYEPLADGDTHRSPKAEKPELRTPAIYTGYILSDPTGNDRQITVLTGAGQSYGRIPETHTRPGASGGAIFRMDGTLLGVTTAITVDPVKYEDVEKNFNVDLQGPDPGDLQYTYVQPVDGQFLADLQSQGADAFTPCPGY